MNKELKFNEELKLAQELIDFIYESPCAFEAVQSVSNSLINEGFKEILEEDRWNLEKGGKYFVTKNQSAIVAFVVGSKDVASEGFRIIAAHTDSPSFRIKPNPEIISENTYLKLNTEVYGAPILNTWMDRPLSIAGRVVLRGENAMNPKIKLLNIKRPLLIIPNLAIHMNRDVNKGVELNAQKDTQPLLSILNEKIEKDNFLLNILSKELCVEMSEIIDFDLYLYEYEKGSIIGYDNEMISSSRLDDLSMVHAGLKAILNVNNSKSTNVIAFFDNEEVGSTTKQGADSPLLSNTLERIVISVTNANENERNARENYLMALAKSFIISADLAHAVHPNSGEKADPINRPLLNKGPVIKYSASMSYTTDAVSASIYEEICGRANVPVQKFVNRSDIKGGSTIGPINSSHLNIRSVDMGSPILAMHSIRELAGVMDHSYTLKSFEEFFK